MKLHQIMIILWIVGWLLCSIGYVISEKKKSESAGREFSLKKALSFVPNLFILWPFTFVVYVWFRTEKKGNNKE